MCLYLSKYASIYVYMCLIMCIYPFNLIIKL